MRNILRGARVMLELTQEKMAEKIGISAIEREREREREREYRIYFSTCSDAYEWYVYGRYNTK